MEALVLYDDSTVFNKVSDAISRAEQRTTRGAAAALQQEVIQDVPSNNNLRKSGV